MLGEKGGRSLLQGRPHLGPRLPQTHSWSSTDFNPTHASKDDQAKGVDNGAPVQSMLCLIRKKVAHKLPFALCQRRDVGTTAGVLVSRWSVLGGRYVPTFTDRSALRNGSRPELDDDWRGRGRPIQAAVIKSMRDQHAPLAIDL